MRENNESVSTLPIEERWKIAEKMLEEGREAGGLRRISRKFTDLHHEILRYVAMGYKKSEIAELHKVSRSTINKIIKSPMGVMILNQLRRARDSMTADVVAGLKKLEPKALIVLDRALTEEGVPWSIKTKVAITILQDIGGYKAPQRVQIAHAIMTPEFIERVKKEAEAAGIALSEGEYEVISEKKKELDLLEYTDISLQ